MADLCRKQPLNRFIASVYSGSYPVAQEIGKLPFSEIFRPMSGNRSIAEAVGSNLQRLLWPRTGPTVKIAERPVNDL